MAVTPSYVEYIDGQLSNFNDFTTRRMFDGIDYNK